MGSFQPKTLLIPETIVLIFRRIICFVKVITSKCLILFWEIHLSLVVHEEQKFIVVLGYANFYDRLARVHNSLGFHVIHNLIMAKTHPIFYPRRNCGWWVDGEAFKQLQRATLMARIQTAEITPCYCRHLLPFKEGKFGEVWALDGSNRNY